MELQEEYLAVASLLDMNLPSSGFPMSWMPPSFPYAKVNIDACFTNQKELGMGIVGRNHWSKITFVAFDKTNEGFSAIMTKTLALRWEMVYLLK